MGGVMALSAGAAGWRTPDWQERQTEPAHDAEQAALGSEGSGLGAIGVQPHLCVDIEDPGTGELRAAAAKGAFLRGLGQLAMQIGAGSLAGSAIGGPAGGFGGAEPLNSSGLPGIY